MRQKPMSLTLISSWEDNNMRARKFWLTIASSVLPRFLAIWLLLSVTAAHGEALLLKSATIHTMSGQGTIFLGDLLINDDRIVAVGTDLSTHPLSLSARVQDLSGKTITPGFLVPWTSIGSVGWPTGRVLSYSDLHSAGYSVGASWTARTDSVGASIVAGVLSVGTVPFNPNQLFSGVAVIASLSQNASPTDYALVARLSSYNGTPAAAVDALEQAFEDAKRYRRNTLVYERGGHYDFAWTRKDLQVIQRVLDGELRLMVQADGAEEIQRLIALSQKEQFRLIIAGGSEADLVAPELANNGIPVVLLPFEGVTNRVDPAKLLQLGHQLHQAGVTVVFGSDAYRGAEFAKLAAGQAVSAGMSPDVALKALTIDAALVLGLPDHGQIASGKMADIVVWDGDPLESFASVHGIVSNERLVKPNSRGLLLGQRYLSRDKYRGVGIDGQQLQRYRLEQSKIRAESETTN